MLRFVRPSARLSVSSSDAVPFARWRYARVENWTGFSSPHTSLARVTVSNAFNRGQHDRLCSHPNAISRGISLRRAMPCWLAQGCLDGQKPSAFCDRDTQSLAVGH